MEIQTRSTTGALAFYPTVKDAMRAAEYDSTIWKISFPLESGERVRLVRSFGDEWKYEPIEVNIERETTQP